MQYYHSQALAVIILLINMENKNTHVFLAETKANTTNLEE